MPYQSLKLVSSVNVEETPATNEAGIAASNLIRIRPDTSPYVLVEKIGGWARFYATQVTSVIRALLAWEDTNANKWLAYGTSSATASQLVALQCSTNAGGLTTASSPTVLTPQYLSDCTLVQFQTTAGSSSITITDNVVTDLSIYDSILITTPVSVGGLILYGSYAITSDSVNSYTITATNILGMAQAAIYTTVASPITVTGGTVGGGSMNLTFAALGSAPFLIGENVNVTGINPPTWNGSCIVTACTTTSVTLVAPAAAASTWVSGGSLSNYGVTPIVTTAAGSPLVTVTFPDHGQTVGSTFSINNQSPVDTITMFGNYIVVTAPNSYTFTINALSSATNTTSAYIGGKIVTGGSSTVSAVTLNLGTSAYNQPVLTLTGGSSTTTAVTLSWNSSLAFNFTVGKSVYVSGIVSPSSWNGTFTVTGATASSVTYALSGSALSWGSGGTAQSPAFNVGAWVQVSGTVPATWNGNFVVTGSTATSVTYALSGSALSWTNYGTVTDIGGDAANAFNIAIGSQPSPVGYGQGPYGAGGYGTGVTSAQVVGTAVFASNWSLDNWGEILLASPVGFAPISYSQTNIPYAPIYWWDPAFHQPQVNVISTGPSAVTGIFVAMPQRQIMAWGCTPVGSNIIDPLEVRWCDVNNFNVWIAQSTNQAGSYRLSTGSAIIGARQVMQQSLFWTDIGLWVANYIGYPLVYSFNQIAQGCGLIARNATGVLNGNTYWMGSRQFFVYGGNGVTPILCPIWDAIFQQLDQANLAKITCAVNSLFEEVAWYYPVSGGNGECSAYVKYNVQTNAWDMGTLARTAWIDNSILGPPIGYDPVNQYIYQHEISTNADGAAIAWSFTTGYFAIAEGNNKVFVDEIWPDFKWGYYNQSQGATVKITFNVVDFPGQTPVAYGPYSVVQATKWFNTRFRGRLVSITASGNDLNSFVRTGNMRFRVAPDGRY